MSQAVFLSFPATIPCCRDSIPLGSGVLIRRDPDRCWLFFIMVTHFAAATKGFIVVTKLDIKNPNTSDFRQPTVNTTN